MIATSGFLTALSAPNSFSAGAPTRTPQGELTAFPRPSGCFKGALRLIGGGEGERRKEEQKGRAREREAPAPFLDY